MAILDGSSKGYGPGVSYEGERIDDGPECYECYSGKGAALIDRGLIKPEWLPGAPGNGKTIQSVVFLGDGTAKLLPAKSRFKAFDVGAGGCRIAKSGGIYRVWRYLTKDERAQKVAERREAEERETWLAAKKANDNSDFPRRWKDGVLYHIDQAERLIEGKLVFTDFPDIGVATADISAAKRVISELRNILARATPRIRNKVQAAGNVFSLNDAAFRNMKKH